MDPTPILVKISQLIQALLLLVEKAKYHKSNCSSLANCINLLRPLLDEVQESKTPLAGAAISSFEALELALVKAKELVERCGGKASRFYVVLRGQQFVILFNNVTSEIDSCLRTLPLGVLQLSSQTKEWVEMCLQDLQETRYWFDSTEEALAEETGYALKELREGLKLSHEKLACLAERFDLRSNQEILREASLLEKEKDYVRVENNRLEEELINQVICLVTQMGDDLAEQKQAATEVGGIPIPADFRCPLSLELMSDPVIVASGQTYERAYIQQWLDQGNTTCPKTRQTLSHKNLIPNYTVKALIANWCEANNVALPEPAKLDILDVQSGPVSSLLPTKSEPNNHRNMQEVVTVSRASTEQVATIGSRPSVRSMRTIRSRVHENRELNNGQVEEAIGPGEEIRESLQGNSRSLFGGDSDGSCETIAIRGVDQQAAGMQCHSRNASSSSLASSIDDAQVTITSDEMNQTTPHVVDDSFPRGNNMSLQLERSTLLSASVPIHQKEHGSSFKGSDRVSAFLRRTSEDHDLNMPRVVSSAGPDTAGADGRNIQLEIERFVDGLKSNSMDAQRSGAAGLRLLAKFNMENRIIIANCGAIRPLVSLLRSTDMETQENAVTALLNLSINDNNKNEIAAAGAIEPLVHVLRVGNSEAKENAAATLFSLSVMDENKVVIGQSGAIQPLVELLMHGTPRGKKDAATALFNLSIHHENKARIVRAGAIRPLVELMSDPAAGMVDKAVAVLANLSTIPEGRLATGEEGGIPALVEVVEMGSQRGKENAAAALLQLCTNSNRYRALVLQEGAIPSLVALSQSGTARAKEKAAALLRLFREQRHAVLGRGNPDRHMGRH